jgi:hypothetical protein
MKYLCITFIPAILSMLFSCGLKEKNETNLNKSDLAFIQKIGILDTNETILLFESNGGLGGLKQSGNFITKKRVASYWIENNRSEMNFAYYSEIDSMKLNNKTNALTLASSITIFAKDQTTFELYIDADSNRLNQFYKKTVELWNQNK